MPLPIHADADVRHVVRYFETFAPASLDTLGRIYADDAVFVDPFNDVRGLGAIHRIYARMFETLDEPCFEVTEVLAQDVRCLLVWTFAFRRRGRASEWRIHGSSLLRFAPDGRIAEHRDYWDAASQLYEKLPFIGALLRVLRRRMA